MPPAAAPSIEDAFRRLRAELAIRTEFPPAVDAEARRVAAERRPDPGPGRADCLDVPFVTIDPPGSRDLDQAVHVAREDGGYRVRYAIADVGFWVDRGGAIEREAWLRGVTFYAPDGKQPLYPPALSEGAASLLPGRPSPAVLFDLRLDAAGTLRAASIARALVGSRAQLTYAELLAGGTAAGAASAPASEWRETLALLGELGPKLIAQEAARGGVTLPARAQLVQRRTAETLGYELVYESPNAAEGWNAQVSLLAGHVAAERMLRAGVGLLRTMPPFTARDVARLRRVARTLGFAWRDDVSYAAFVHTLDPAHPRIDVLARQAREVMRGADYVAFDGDAPEQPTHGALARTYAHVTAPLRRLADRYVLDLLVAIDAGTPVSADERATIGALPEVMNAADRTSGRLERRLVDVAEAWALRDAAGTVLPAVVIDVDRDEVEVQLEEPPVRTTLRSSAAAPALGAATGVRVLGVDVSTGRVDLALDPPGDADTARAARP